MITLASVAVPATNITLRSPDLGDSDSHNIKTRFRRSMSGVIHGYRYTPADSVLLFRWRHLNVTDRADLIAFLKATIAQEVDVTLSYQANAEPIAATSVWRGKFISDPFEFETTGRHGGTCIEISTITLQFRGVRI